MPFRTTIFTIFSVERHTFGTNLSHISSEAHLEHIRYLRWLYVTFVNNTSFILPHYKIFFSE